MSNKGLLPACMMPDGANPCQAFTDQMDEIEKLKMSVLNHQQEISNLKSKIEEKEYRWQEKYSGYSAPLGERSMDITTFRPMVDQTVNQVMEGLIDLDEVQGIAYMALEIIKDHQLRHPEWKPLTAEQRRKNHDDQLLQVMMSVSAPIFLKQDT